MGIFLLAFFAGPSTALLHVWLCPGVKGKMRWTHNLTIGFDAYFQAYRYLLKNGHHHE